MKNSLVEGDKNRATGRDGGRKKVEGTLDLEPEAKRRGSADVRITHRASYRQFGHDPVFVQPSATRENARDVPFTHAMRCLCGRREKELKFTLGSSIFFVSSATKLNE